MRERACLQNRDSHQDGPVVESDQEEDRAKTEVPSARRENLTKESSEEEVQRSEGEYDESKRTWQETASRKRGREIAMRAGQTSRHGHEAEAAHAS